MSIDRDISIRQKLKPFNQFLQMEGVTEIAVNRPGQLYYERERSLESSLASEPNL